MTPEQKAALIVAVLRKGKAAIPDRFPQANAETTKSWLDMLSPLIDVFPIPELWEEAVNVWAVELVGDRMATPRELKQAVYVVRDRWEKVPEKARVLEQRRAHRQELHDRQIAEGTRAAAMGYRRPLALEREAERGSGRMPDALRDAWRKTVQKAKGGGFDA